MTPPVGISDESRSVAGVAVAAHAVRTTQLPSGEAVPVLGQGTWYLGEGRRSRAEEIAALRLGLDLGMGLIDPAEMYGNGAAEELVGEAIAGRRDEVFLISKVLASNATRSGTIAACEGSLWRLRIDQLDLYLLHWRGAIPLAETLQGFETLIRARKIRYWGVSNFDLADMQEFWSLPGGAAAVTDQVLYNLARRAIEWDLLPWCRARPADHGLLAIEQGQRLAHPVLQSVAVWHGATAAQVALRGCSGTATRLRSRGPGTRVTCGRIAPRSTFGSRHRIWPRSIAHSRRQQGRSRSRCSKLGACRPNKRPA